MPATVSGIIDTVRLKLNHSSLSDVAILDMINDTQRIMQRAYPIKWQETLSSITVATVAASAVQSFTIPTDQKTIINVFGFISSQENIIQHHADLGYLHKNFTAATEVKLPYFWTVFGLTGYLFPRLSSALTTHLHYQAFFNDFTAIGGSNNFLVFAPEVLQFGAIAEYYDAIYETDKAKIWHAKAAEAMLPHTVPEYPRDFEPLVPSPYTPEQTRARNLRSGLRTRQPGEDK
jgi:hypothetical protein